MEFTTIAQAGDTVRFEEILSLAMSTLGNETLEESILLVTHEQLANVREHQYHNDVTGVIALSIKITNREVVVAIMDGGREWCKDGYYDDLGAEYKLRDLAERGAQRGRGLLITCILADSFRFTHGGRVRQMAFHRGCCGK